MPPSSDGGLRAGGCRGGRAGGGGAARGRPGSEARGLGDDKDPRDPHGRHLRHQQLLPPVDDARDAEPVVGHAGAVHQHLHEAERDGECSTRETACLVAVLKADQPLCNILLP